MTLFLIAESDISGDSGAGAPSIGGIFSTKEKAIDAILHRIEQIEPEEDLFEKARESLNMNGYYNHENFTWWEVVELSEDQDLGDHWHVLGNELY